MSRALRIIDENACYHVINRSNTGQLIFDSPPMYLEFQLLLEKYVKKFKIRIYHYVLMPNHIHLLVEPGKADLSRFMQGITLAHTRRVNDRHKSHGHLWQGRFKSFLISKDEYFLSCGQYYIEQNPVRAGFVAHPSKYLWSSYHAYAQGIHNPIVALDQFFLNLDCTAEGRRSKYQQYLSPLISGPDTNSGQKSS